MHTLGLTLFVLPFVQAIPDGVERITEAATVRGDSLDARSRLAGPFALQGDRALVSDHIEGDSSKVVSRVLELRLGGDSIELLGELLPTDPVPCNHFGRALDLDEEVALIGAMSPYGGPEQRGAAYVFRRAGVGWDQEARLEPDSDRHARFGRAVAIEGDRALVAATAGRDGCVYAFARTEAGWSRVDLLEPAELEPGEGFGRAVALCGDRVVISSDRRSGERVFAYRWDGELRLEQVIECPPAAAKGGFGDVIALDGDHLLIGAESMRLLEGRAGGVYPYHWKDQRWQPGPVLGADSRWFRFGRSLALSEDTAAIGALSSTHGDEPGGLALVYRWIHEDWRPVIALAPAGPYPNPETGRKVGMFGEVLTIDGDRILVGESAVLLPPHLWSFRLR